MDSSIKRTSTEVELHKNVPVRRDFQGSRGAILISRQQIQDVTLDTLRQLDKATRQYTNTHPEITVFRDHEAEVGPWAIVLLYMPTDEVEDWLNEQRRLQGKPPAPWSPPPRSQPAVAGPPVKTNKEILRERRELERRQKALEASIKIPDPNGDHGWEAIQ